MEKRDENLQETSAASTVEPAVEAVRDSAVKAVAESAPQAVSPAYAAAPVGVSQAGTASVHTPLSAEEEEAALEAMLAEDERAAFEQEQRRLGTLSDDDDEPELEVPRDTWTTVRRLWAESADQHWRFFLVVVSIVFYTLFSLAAPAYSAHVIDLLWNEAQAAFADGRTFAISWEHGGQEILIYLGIWTITVGFYSLQSFTMSSFSERLNLILRNRVSEKLNRLPLSFFDTHKPGDVVSRATNDLDKMSEVLQRGILTLLTAVGSVTGAIIMMFTYNALLASLFIVFSAISLLLTRAISRRNLVLAANRQECVGELTSAVEEAYSGRIVVRAFGREERSSQEMRELADRLAEASCKADFVTNAVSSLIRFVNRLAQVTIALFGCGMLVAGRMSVGVLQAFFQYIMTAAEPLTQLSFTINSMQSALASVERVFDLLDEEEISPEPAPELAAHVAEPTLGRVCFEHVKFGYNPERPLMHDVSFTAEPGQKIAIVGTTGAGKTTLINLLMRFYEIDGGRITLDGVDTRQMDRGELRSNFGMVLQDAWLFEGTIAENIAYGCDGASRERVEAVARTARVDYFVRTMPHGYETLVANDAENISQGQRQLLTIARVLLRNPRILILDEATSSVDTRTEQAIGHAMQELMRGRTSFVIAHRLSTIVDADLILVMDKGTIIEQGTHEELLEAGGAYARLYRSQFS